MIIMIQLQLLGVLSMQQCTKAALWFNLAAICEGVFPCDKRVARQHVHFANWQHSTRHGPPAYPRPPRPQRARRGDDPCPVVEDSEMTQSTANAMPMQCQWNLSNPKYVYYIEREIQYIICSQNVSGCAKQRNPHPISRATGKVFPGWVTIHESKQTRCRKAGRLQMPPWE